mmetsp:Transcript_15758/g.32331  ORF Transcript_15758/g.32331 Transcript_15758/m.32331 type:complete len:246 (-) Transcript_15758:2664-3401(-)
MRKRLANAHPVLKLERCDLFVKRRRRFPGHSHGLRSFVRDAGLAGGRWGLRSEVPNFEDAVAAAAEQGGRVAEETNVLHGVVVAVQPTQGQTRGHVPKDEEVVETRGHEALAFVAEGYTVHSGLMAQQSGHEVPRLGVPQPHRAVARTRRDALFVKTEVGLVDAVVVAPRVHHSFERLHSERADEPRIPTASRHRKLVHRTHLGEVALRHLPSKPGQGGERVAAAVRVKSIPSKHGRGHGSLAPR